MNMIFTTLVFVMIEMSKLMLVKTVQCLSYTEHNTTKAKKGSEDEACKI